MTNKNIPVFSMKPRLKMLHNTIVYLTQFFMINRTKFLYKKKRKKNGSTDIKEKYMHQITRTNNNSLNLN